MWEISNRARKFRIKSLRGNLRNLFAIKNRQLFERRGMTVRVSI
jgi:hypothetical protein